jgi:hypothetical protein
MQTRKVEASASATEFADFGRELLLTLNPGGVKRRGEGVDTTAAQIRTRVAAKELKQGPEFQGHSARM